MKVAGFGFRADVSVSSLCDALEAAGGTADLRGIATLADKAEHAVFQEFGRKVGLPIEAIAQDRIKAVDVTTHSAKSHRLRGTGSVSEAAALAAAGPGARLSTTRAISADKMATCAIASEKNT